MNAAAIVTGGAWGTGQAHGLGAGECFRAGRANPELIRVLVASCL